VNNEKIKNIESMKVKEEVFILFLIVANVSAKVIRNGLVGKAVCLSLCWALFLIYFSVSESNCVFSKNYW
jgi:predicted metal-binding membrane protein